MHAYRYISPSTFILLLSMTAQSDDSSYTLICYLFHHVDAGCPDSELQIDVTENLYYIQRWVYLLEKVGSKRYKYASLTLLFVFIPSRCGRQPVQRLPFMAIGSASVVCKIDDFSSARGERQGCPI